jgi:hypothetical protein
MQSKLDIDVRLQKIVHLETLRQLRVGLAVQAHTFKNQNLHWTPELTAEF